MITRDIVFRDRYGLHPRAARRIEERLAGLDATVRLEDLETGATPIDASSVLALISSGIRSGGRVQISADGPAAEEAVATIGDLVEAGVCHPTS